MIQTIDVLLSKNTYFKNLSVADRLAIYNIALKQVAELRNYFYTNQSSSTNFLINNSNILSSIDSVDNILLDDLSSLSVQERLLIYNIIQSRIGSLRNLQNYHYYSVSNIRGQLKNVRILSIPILKFIRTITAVIKEKFLVLPIAKSIVLFTVTVHQKVLALPIAISIVSGLQKIKYLRLPISFSLRMISLFTAKTKLLPLPIQNTINLIATGTTKIKSLLLPLSNTITIVFASVTIHQKLLRLPLTKSIITLATYQHLKEKRLTMPLNNSINTI